MKDQDEHGHVLCMWYMSENKKVIWHMRPLDEWHGHAGYKNATAKLSYRGTVPKPAAKPAAQSAVKPTAKPSVATTAKNGRTTKK